MIKLISDNNGVDDGGDEWSKSEYEIPPGNHRVLLITLTGRWAQREASRLEADGWALASSSGGVYVLSKPVD